MSYQRPTGNCWRLGYLAKEGYDCIISPSGAPGHRQQPLLGEQGSQWEGEPCSIITPGRSRMRWVAGSVYSDKTQGKTLLMVQEEEEAIRAGL